MAPNRHPVFASTPTATRRRRSSSTADTVAAESAAARARRLNTVISPGARSPGLTWVDTALDHPQLVTAAVISVVFLTGTAIGYYFDLAIHTSMLAHVHNHSTQRTAYFARKSNLFNRVFVKKAWGWTAALYLLHLFTSSPTLHGREAGVGRVNPALHAAMPTCSVWRTRSQRLAHLVLASLAWIAFTAWFFGAGIGDRIIAATGGTCAVPLPATVDPGSLDDILAPGAALIVTSTPGQPHIAGNSGPGVARVYLPLHNDYCMHHRPLNPSTFPRLFEILAGATADAAADMAAEAHRLHAKSHEILRLPPPRWSSGFDVSGHAFLLTLGACVLASEMATTWRARRYRLPPSQDTAATTPREVLHYGATIAGTALIALWVWMLGTTSVYFHDPHEKIAGLALGLVAAAATNYMIPRGTAGPVIEFKVRGPTRRPSPRSSGSGGSGSSPVTASSSDHPAVFDGSPTTGTTALPGAKNSILTGSGGAGAVIVDSPMAKSNIHFKAE